MMQQENAVKKYPVRELKAGMIVGRSVYDDNEKELIAEGTVLTNPLIASILDSQIQFIAIKNDPPKAILRDAHVLDEGFVRKYENTLENIRRLFETARQAKKVDVALFQRIADECYLEFSDGLKAITHVHNILREGDYLLYHSVNVAILAGVLGRWLNLSKEDLRDLVLAGLLHDIGKTQIADEILNKPDKLTEEEMALARQHPVKGYELLKTTVLKDKKSILFGILQHHERLDRSGYPERLAGEGISSFAKILAVVDIYDAMAANKVYAPKKSPFDIFEELFKEMMGRLDPKNGVPFIKNVRRAMNGNLVRLSSGDKAKIIYLDENSIRMLPIVQTEDGAFFDLNKDRDVCVTELLSHAQ